MSIISSSGSQIQPTAPGPSPGPTPPTVTNPRILAKLAALGIKDQTWDAAAGSGQSAGLVSQQMYAAAIGLNAGDVITNMILGVTQAGVGVAPAGIFGGIYSAANVLLASSANLAGGAQWTSLGIKAVPLSAPLAISATGLYYFAILENGAFGTTPLQVWLGAVNANMVSYPGGLMSWHQAGLTTLPANAVPVADNTQIWFGWS